MTARTDAALEAQYALAGALAAIEGRLTQMVDSIRGQVINGVLFAGTVILDSNGTYTTSFEVPFGSVAVGNASASTVTFQNEGPQVSAPTSGVGVFTVGCGKAATVPVAGRALTLYGPAGGSVQLSVYDRPLGAAALGPVNSSSSTPKTLTLPVGAGGGAVTTAVQIEGFALRETTGLAVAKVELRNTAGALVIPVNLAANESARDWFGSPGFATAGLTVVVTAGSIDGSVFYR